MSEDRSSKKRKNKANYFSNFKKTKSFTTLEADDRGFIVTCSGEERRALLECYNILNQVSKEAEDTDVKSSETNTDNLDNELEKELKELKADKPFKQVMTNIKCVLFVKLFKPEHDPIDLMNKIYDTAKAGELNCRFIRKLIPIVYTCNVAQIPILNGFKRLLNEIKDEEGSTITYRIEVTTRLNNKIKRDDIIVEIAKLVKEVKPDWTVNLTKPTKVLYLDVLHRVAGLSVLDDYYQRNKYNLNIICNGNNQTTGKQSKDVDKSVAEDKGNDEETVESKDTKEGESEVKNENKDEIEGKDDNRKDETESKDENKKEETDLKDEQ